VGSFGWWPRTGLAPRGCFVLLRTHRRGLPTT
jgi:hypothetical protein